LINTVFRQTTNIRGGDSRELIMTGNGLGKLSETTDTARSRFELRFLTVTTTADGSNIMRAVKNDGIGPIMEMADRSLSK